MRPFTSFLVNDIRFTHGRCVTAAGSATTDDSEADTTREQMALFLARLQRIAFYPLPITNQDWSTP